ETGRPGDKETGRGLEIWPNPARGIVDCRWSIFDGRGDVVLMIYDVFGREVAEIKVPGKQDQVQINVESYPPGVYIAVLRNGGDFLGSGKFVVR
ncbi:MAG TPA: T9SS type A sorting domain-containing protein, partial [Bacteroidales bacterium]|nr:T9SS type A sorting domain-containing protein [Bacteroidales bacterium]